MRLSELAQRTGVPIPTIKYYLREHLLADGERRSARESIYGESHVRRLLVIRALAATGVSVSDARELLRTVDNPPPTFSKLLGAAHAAVAPATDPTVDPTEARLVVERMGWRTNSSHSNSLVGVQLALQALSQSGFEMSDDLLEAYMDSARHIARAEIASVPLDSPESAVNHVVLGTVLLEPLLLALRRLAQEIESEQRFSSDGNLGEIGA